MKASFQNTLTSTKGETKTTRNTLQVLGQVMFRLSLKAKNFGLHFDTQNSGFTMAAFHKEKRCERVLS